MTEYRGTGIENELKCAIIFMSTINIERIIKEETAEKLAPFDSPVKFLIGGGFKYVVKCYLAIREIFKIINS